MLAQKELVRIQKSFRGDKDRLPLVFAALGDPTRLKIFRLLSEKKDLCVTDVAKVCGMSVAAASHQLRLLEFVELAHRERMGKMICYELRKDDPLVKKVMSIIQ
ncbi:MAG: hypothetical protein A3D64_00145 [Candidatus Wildermuthbacteria bacterium RIFCSPHIGHO2_02_FULL_49_9]|uniref:HTH arsR-type domain-containing protein n=2 Tax=Candidatus Wildermuthiibacteriota TaxID=1817923 RepID=A0A1G2R177_9BACT|nr:MAG: hypothetical protein A2672_02590 [Candidatus Wildermuthbacteria bacterium RIFCSPHIGHO2_01_FULL_49_22b]OHA71064.1 MAG: hypothetical protein A3D64_00145 [Candidatus Wildermuthbacteria bacterium RIFCSPHIGHO2_02_FULL_49_9]